MKKLIFVRHAKPDFPTNDRYCVGGRTDWPIGEEGRIQCEQLAEKLLPVLEEERKNGRKTEIWSSPLIRAVQTARYLCEDGEKPQIAEDLREMDAGEWEGLSFPEIRKRFPEIFETRRSGAGMTLIPGAESNEKGLERFQKAIGEILEKSEADTIVIVAHGTVISLYLCMLAGKPLTSCGDFKPEYTEITEVWDGAE